MHHVEVFLSATAQNESGIGNSFAVCSPVMKNAEPQLQKDPDDWKTGDEPMTPAQRSYLETLAQDLGETFDDADLTKAEASKRIEELKSQSPRVNGKEQ
jgi:hypothetical protein